MNLSLLGTTLVAGHLLFGAAAFRLSSFRSSISRRHSRLGAIDLAQLTDSFKDTKGVFPKVEATADEAGLVVWPNQWKFPASWPFPESDFRCPDNSSDIAFYNTPVFRSVDGDLSLPPTRLFGDSAKSRLEAHMRRYVKEGMSVLDIGAAENSYIPEEIETDQTIGIGVREDELANNPCLTDYMTKNLNEETSLSEFRNNAFDVVTMHSTIQYMKAPRELLKEVWRVLKPGGMLIISFTSKLNNRKLDKKELGWYKRMNDAQKLWVTGSLFHFSTGEGWTEMRGFDLSPNSEGQGDGKNVVDRMMDKGKEQEQSDNLYIVQAQKMVPVVDARDPFKSMLGLLVTDSEVEDSERTLVCKRLTALCNRVGGDSQKEEIIRSVQMLPGIYEILKQVVVTQFPQPLRAKLAAMLLASPEWKGSEGQKAALRQAMGLERSPDFWEPLGVLCPDVTAEDRIIWIADIIPRLSGNEESDKRVKESIHQFSGVGDIIRAQCPHWTSEDRQMMAVDLVVTDWIDESDEGRVGVLNWLKTLSRDDFDALLEHRKKYKREITPSE
uniref:Methyltransferase type 11 domain-containing protein n=1 Tax=Chromera velia CCMP2878 TaxID=1169474 RepID=A0A0G4HA01_9ALVE|mmetsp:Transcript_7939/g.15455  ORF Transcript_7939/g.15455 Transcript_7939/m.15455 type:complete len:554 (+) Transcript_7939:142-1803(+)|eukprot:Cvel_25539.t1-p1 / transcript=Cvel_25539.t1 / gene=Cvel_25539 / organism=Chromera_velia_CCMP2878 / gene_product=hypothetical protein / transcript_product=hypothetical protein / location=Cvel_scaffold2907:4473-8908(-) / protein_length=553 / sequence_SO=supercontig / SO=protein_coding / is_pseudo=false